MYMYVHIEIICIYTYIHVYRLYVYVYVNHTTVKHDELVLWKEPLSFEQKVSSRSNRWAGRGTSAFLVVLPWAGFDRFPPAFVSKKGMLHFDFISP